jgi:thiol-disulfide isomerase/thioredoxin
MIIFYLFSSIAQSQGYEIRVKIPKLKNQKVILGHHFTTQLIPDDTTILNANGEGVFKDKQKLPGGMYFIFLPSRNYFDILVSDNQKFTIENDTTPADFIKNIKVTGDKENQIFVDYQKFLASQREKSTALSEEYKATTDEAKKKELENQFKELNNSVAKQIDAIISTNPGFFFSKFLKATQEVVIPESLTEQKDKYYFYRYNYFKYFDFKDSRLLRTPIYEGRLDNYLDKVIPQAPDSIIPEVDVLIENSRHDKELFRYMLVHLFNKYAGSQLMGMENVYIHIAEKYYIPEASWSDKKFIDELKTTVERKKPALIGNLAPELKMILLPSDSLAILNLKESLESMKEKGDAILKNETLIKNNMVKYKSTFPNHTDSALRSQVIISELATILENQFLQGFEGYISLLAQKSKYTILYFWEPDCSHCKEETPKFSKAYDEKKLKEKGVNVISVYLHRNINEWEKYSKHIETWFDFVLNNGMMKWQNVWDPFANSQYREKYDISSSPVLYLLDKDNKIIAKRIGYEQAIEIMNEIEKTETK